MNILNVDLITFLFPEGSISDTKVTYAQEKKNRRTVGWFIHPNVNVLSLGDFDCSDRKKREGKWNFCTFLYFNSKSQHAYVLNRGEETS